MPWSHCQHFLKSSRLDAWLSLCPLGSTDVSSSQDSFVARKR
jgi:hypothetical protein